MSGFRWPRPYRSFKRANARRHELIAKQHSLTPDHERKLPYADHPGMRERHEALSAAALTQAEKNELALVTELTGAYLEAKFPRSTNVPDDLEALVRKLEARAREKEDAR